MIVIASKLLVILECL